MSAWLRNPKSVLLPVVAAAVFAGLGRMVLQKIKADRAARRATWPDPWTKDARLDQRGRPHTPAVGRRFWRARTPQ